MVDLLGIPVDGARLEAWAGYLSPDPQPLVVVDDARWDGLGVADGDLGREVRDTFRLWAAPADSRRVWLTATAFRELDRRTRSELVCEQVRRRAGDRAGVGRVPTVRAWSDLLDAGRLRAEADGHRFLWWPDLVAVDPVGVLTRLVGTDRLPSRHADVPAATWHRCAAVLPGARALAGTWPPIGEPANCFTTVLEAAGADASGACDDVSVFERWLREACRPVRRTVHGDPAAVGTVLVWRFDGAPVHAAVCLGDGWVLEKPSQEWHAPRAVVRVDEVVRATRSAGQHLERHRLVA